MADDPIETVSEVPIATVPADDKENLAAFISEPERHHHHHAPPEDEIRVAAYYLWQASGSPLFNAAITMENWIDAEENLEHHHVTE